MHQLLLEMENKDNNTPSSQYFTEFGEIDRAQTVAILNDQSIVHLFTKTDIFTKQSKNSSFIFKDHYSSGIF